MAKLGDMNLWQDAGKRIRGCAAWRLDKRPLQCAAKILRVSCNRVIDRVLVNARSVDPCGTTPSIFFHSESGPRSMSEPA